MLCVKAPGFSLRRLRAIQPVATLPRAWLLPVPTGLMPGMDAASFRMASLQASDARTGDPVSVGSSPWQVISLLGSFPRVPKHSPAALTPALTGSLVMLMVRSEGGCLSPLHHPALAVTSASGRVQIFLATAHAFGLGRDGGRAGRDTVLCLVFQSKTQALSELLWVSWLP